ncbi:MAG: preprotein translocase subunit Sec61beta [Candidatus Aenigmatarchaeota archaeon]|nr:preprotein translocase subunit Sec61beta [Candidatus Aenigmarchaeota archaeon]
MAEKLKIQTPASMGGLVRYYEEDKSLIKLKPEHVVLICTGFAALEIILTLLTKAPVV